MDLGEHETRPRKPMNNGSKQCSTCLPWVEQRYQICLSAVFPLPYCNDNDISRKLFFLATNNVAVVRRSLVVEAACDDIPQHATVQQDGVRTEGLQLTLDDGRPDESQRGESFPGIAASAAVHFRRPNRRRHLIGRAARYQARLARSSASSWALSTRP